MARKINSREYFRTLNIIYMGQLSALVLFAALAYYLIRSGKMGPESLSR